MKKENLKIIIISILLTIELFTVFLMWKSNGENNVVLENVNLKNELVNKKSNLAIMLGDKEGIYTESSDSVWPSNLKYNYNSERSGCIDINGNEIVNALTYDNNTSMITISSNKTAYCYLYFDLDGVAPQSFEFYLGGLSNPDYINSNAVDVYINYNDNDISHYCVTEGNSSNNCEWIETSNSPINGMYTLSSTDGLKTVYAYIKDLAGNISEQVIDTINLDTSKPTGNTISINSNAAYTQSTSVTLTLSSTGASEMCISNTNSCTSWEPYATSKSWTLTSTDGNKTVYVWYKDIAGNISDVVSDLITLDSAAPSSNSVSINNNDAYTTSTSVTLTLNSTGATKMCISNSSSCSSYLNYATSYNWTLSSGLGSKTVYVYFKDEAGNVSSVATDSINLYSVISTVPSQSGTLTYSGSAQSPSWSNYDSNKLTLGGTTSKTDAGTYSATFTPKTNYIWSDGTSTAKSVNWSIAKAKISTVPSQSGTLTYTGSAQSPSWSNYVSSKLTLGGTTSKTAAGTYSATFTPKTNYIWSDGTTTAKSVNWSIAKAAGSLNLSSSSVSINVGTSTNVTATRAGNGTVSATSNKTSVATVSVSGTTITIKGVASGTATITVSVAAGTNHTAPSNKTISVTVNIPTVGNYILNTLKPSGLNTTMEGGLYRFQGTNDTVNNYICFGTSDKSVCTGNVDAYMYRIIGINSSGQLKLIRKETLGVAYQWHSSYYNNTGWLNTDLYKALNTGVLNSATYFPGGSEKIATTTWKWGTNASYDVSADNLYSIENGWTNTINAKIGLMYAHDYYYAYQSGGLNCGNLYDTCKNSWIYLWNSGNDNNAPNLDYEWTMSRYHYEDIYGGLCSATCISADGKVSGALLTNTYSVRPVFYLTSDVQYISGSGTLTDPIIIQ